MTQLISQQEQQLQALIAEAARKQSGLEVELRTLDAELATCQSQQARYQALDETCSALEKLRVAGGESLFREATGGDPERQLQQLRGLVSVFREKVAVLEQARSRLQADIGAVRASSDALQKQLAGLRRKIAHPDKYDMQGRSMPYRALPWATHGEDELRFRKLLIGFLCAGILFGGLIPILKPPVEQQAGIVVPERIARIIKKKQEVKQEELKQREQAAEKAAAEKAAEKAAAKPAETTPPVAAVPPTDADIARRRKSAETKGVLAFKSDLANLLDDSPLPKMGSDARISVKAGQASGRSIIVSQSDGGGTGGGRIGASALVSQSIAGSGGIDTAGLNRQIGGGTGQRIAESEVKIARVESATIAAAPGADRPLSGGSGPSRTDEEIQVVFDRYKAALYRMYNKELRVNASLRGKLVLQITIDPDGKVSQCIVKTDEMGAPGFTSEIVNRVRSFNFGPKEGVQTITILYPIEFLPPS